MYPTIISDIPIFRDTLTIQHAYATHCQLEAGLMKESLAKYLKCGAHFILMTLTKPWP